MALTAQQMQGAYAQAMEASEISIMRREDLERLMMEKPEVGLQISHLLSERLRRYETRLEDITLKRCYRPPGESAPAPFGERGGGDW
jgi:CRP/FNR family transcriptional regulator, cyclic AMP receptor protein